MKKRKRKIFALGTMVVLLLAVAAVPASATRPFRGDMDIQFVGGTCAVVWMGTLQVDSEVYGLTFAGPGTDVFGQSAHWTEIWKVYRNPATGSSCPSDLLMEGQLVGHGNFANDKIVENGYVTSVEDVSNNPFEGLDGRSMHATAVVEGFPPVASFEGIFRLN